MKICDTCRYQTSDMSVCHGCVKYNKWETKTMKEKHCDCGGCYGYHYPTCDKREEGVDYGDTEEQKMDVALEQWARMVKVADKFTLMRLEDTGEEWTEFCATMNALVLERKIIA